MARPSIGTGLPLQIGPLNTWCCNWGPPYAVPPVVQPSGAVLNTIEQLTIGEVVITNDDLYRRILTWHFYKGDGNYFSVRWLKARMRRFCMEMNVTVLDPSIKATLQTPGKLVSQLELIVILLFVLF